MALTRRYATYAALIFAGACVGTAARAALEGSFAPPPGQWPWTTFVINVSGSLALGFLLEALARRWGESETSRRLRFALGTGLLGGFTTYSTFALEAVNLVRSGSLVIALGYLVVSPAVGIAAAFAGLAMARRRVASTQSRTS